MRPIHVLHVDDEPDFAEIAASSLEREDERITDGFFAVDSSWRYTYANGQGADLVGYDRDALQGTVVWEAFPELVDTPFEDVTVTVGELPDGFYVEDDGPGIPEDDRETVFEAGYSTAENGTGFGLSIVRRVAEAHGWAVSVCEGSDGGARFEVRGVPLES